MEIHTGEEARRKESLKGSGPLYQQLLKEKDSVRRKTRLPFSLPTTGLGSFLLLFSQRAALQLPVEQMFCMQVQTLAGKGRNFIEPRWYWDRWTSGLTLCMAASNAPLPSCRWTGAPRNWTRVFPNVAHALYHYWEMGLSFWGGDSSSQGGDMAQMNF